MPRFLGIIALAFVSCRIGASFEYNAGELQCIESAADGDAHSVELLLTLVGGERFQQVVVDCIQVSVIFGHESQMTMLLNHRDFRPVDAAPLQVAARIARRTHRFHMRDLLLQFIDERFDPSEVDADVGFTISHVVLDYLVTRPIRMSSSPNQSPPNSDYISSSPAHGRSRSWPPDPHRRVYAVPLQGDSMQSMGSALSNPGSQRDAASVASRMQEDGDDSSTDGTVYDSFASSDESSEADLGLFRQVHRSWVYTVEDGTREQQADAFLSAILERSNSASDLQDDLRSRLFVRADLTRNGSVGIDEGGLSATLIQSTMTLLLGRLARAGYVFTSSGNRQTMIPAQVQVLNDNDRDLLAALGILIGMTLNSHIWTPGKVSLAVPLPVLFFDALLLHETGVVPGRVRETAFWSEYEHWCGSLSPSDCLQWTGFDIADAFPTLDNMTGKGLLAKDEYLINLVRSLMNGDAMWTIRTGFHSSVERHLLALSGEQIHALVIADPTVNFAGLDSMTTLHVAPNIKGRVRQRVEVSLTKVLRDGFDDEQRADFVELTTGVRGLPILNDRSTALHIVVEHRDSLEVHTCFRSIHIPTAIAVNPDFLYDMLVSMMRDSAERGIDSIAYNTR
ncbi:HECT domain-containing protein [Plasmodiophora brassicae]